MRLGFIRFTHSGYAHTVGELELLNDAEQNYPIGDFIYYRPRNVLLESYNSKKITNLLKERNDIDYAWGSCDTDVVKLMLEKELSSKSRVVTLEGYRIFSSWL